MTEAKHISVLLDECIENLNIKPDGIYVDGTLGLGGHSYQIASRLTTGRLIGIDRDETAIERAGRRLEPFKERLTLVHGNFCDVAAILDELGITAVDGMLFDLGVSSPQLDEIERGFSYMGDAPLDMRMNTRAKRTAADIINSYTKEELSRIFSEYGELDTTWKIANCIERSRLVAPITTTAELVEAVRPCTPPKDEAKFLTKLFQALRIELNGEMEALKMALEQSLKLLRPGGRLVVISYHSLEDRIVKNFMRSGNSEGIITKDFFGRSTTPLRVITRKAIVPTAEEVERNPRSRSAKLRVAEKIEVE